MTFYYEHVELDSQEIELNDIDLNAAQGCGPEVIIIKIPMIPTMMRQIHIGGMMKRISRDGLPTKWK